SIARRYSLLLVPASCVGVGSAVFHPESSRVARMASGGRHGLAQSVFQVGGNAGGSLGPLLAAFIVVPHGQSSIAWFSLAALLGIVVLFNVGRWYRAHHQRTAAAAHSHPGRHLELSPSQVRLALGVLMVLVFSKYFYLASL